MTKLGKPSLAALADDPRWVAYKIEVRNGRPTKVPKNPRTGENARVPTDPATYGTRAEAEQRFQKIKKSGADGGTGIVLGRLDDDYHLVGVDLDSCVDNGVITGWAKEVIERFETYAEVSPSGTGVKLFFMMTATGFAKLQDLLGGKKRKMFPARKGALAIDHGTDLSTSCVIRAEIVGADRCCAEGHRVRSATPVLAVCRKLIAAGVDPARPLEAYRAGTLCLLIRSIGDGAVGGR